MNKKKLFAVVISLALVIGVVLPGTLALSTDQTPSNGTIEVPTETTTPAPDTTETPVPEGTEAPAETPTEEPVKTCTCDPKPAEGEAHKEGCPLYVAPEQPAEAEKTCTCDPKPAEGEAHKEGCPLYVAPEQPAEAEKTCTCDPKPAEGETHREGCPLYVKPVSDASKHIDTCTEGCTGEDCKCPCHLFDKIMACTTLDDIWAAFDEASDETVNALTDEQNAQIDAKIEALEPAPAPAVVIEESTEETVPSEIVYRTVNYTYVAPFGEPVTGGN